MRLTVLASALQVALMEAGEVGMVPVLFVLFAVCVDAVSVRV